VAVVRPKALVAWSVQVVDWFGITVTPAFISEECAVVIRNIDGRDSTAADRFLSAAIRARVVPIDERLAIADAMIYAIAVAAGAQLATSDAHFQALPEATVFGAEPGASY